ncbi:TetR family transcriptional regulator [Pseudomonas daroniae]|uniref:TetR family transcriptional regulator n=1 Tax=Phytopseudomonas daroniae TaxID=2487519 RepID=A0A4V2KBC4_9GAMM|nr:MULTISPECIES: TetR/AcrR family transcriptional regulator [Pseudomonas]TBU76879.1 TetR family transcriptional regulator [Pseudomonas sp. FRB 228]TBU84054.1 TetR family transcriptional regulator [Pseudomonas daroniae]TBU93232.1 TetR family transcriptional regulator [Pseudomonas daroniae]
MKTRERILETTLLLFNERGEPNVSTLEIANELGISPGNLYYHFHGKEPLILELFEQFQARLSTLLAPPAEADLDAQDYWLFLHLIAEGMSAYRFLFQDLSHLSGRLPKLAHGMRLWLGKLRRTLTTLLMRLKQQNELDSDDYALEQLVEQIVLTLLFSQDYQRIVAQHADSRLVVYQVMMLVAPHLQDGARQTTELLARSYLRDASA